MARRGLRVLSANLSHLQTNFGPKIFDFFRCRKNFHPKSCEIAQKSARPDDGRPLQHYSRSSQGRRSTGTTRRAGFVAHFIAFRTENFRNFLRGRKIFHPKSREIAPKCMPPGEDPSLNPQSLPQTTPWHCSTGWYTFLTLFDAFCAYCASVWSLHFHRNSRKITIMHIDGHI